MSGMPLLQAFAALVAVIMLLAAIEWRRLHPFVAIVIVAAAFALSVGFSIGSLGKTFGTGFSQAIYGPGLVMIAAAFIGALAESTAAAVWLAARFEGGRGRARTTFAALLGLIAGIAASPAAAFAILTPLLRSAVGAAAAKREPGLLAPALAVSAGHGLLLFSPVPIAAASILDASWARVAIIGPPLALLLAACGTVWAWWSGVAGPGVKPAPAEQQPIAAARGGWPATVLLAATAMPLLLLMVQSVGDMPSEPLGGGTARELVIGIGRPLMLLLVGVGIMVIGLGRPGAKLVADAAWTGRVLSDVAGVLLVVGAAGGLQRLCQDTGMAELLGERLLGWHVAGFYGLLIPFLVAAVMKTLQGSSLVAAITAAGMLQPVLASLGLGDANGKALAALAVGAGAMTASHVNDEYFWLVTTTAGLSPLRGIAVLTAGTLLQGLLAVAALLAISVLTSAL